jgi:hypothetical protein
MLLPTGSSIGNLAGVQLLSGIWAGALGGNPFEERAHASAFTPHQADEGGAIEMRGVFAEVSFKAPLQIRRRPRPQTIALRGNPVVAQRVQHARAGRRGADARIVW